MTPPPLGSTSKIVWLSWEIHRRNRSLSSFIKTHLYELGTGKTGVERYFSCTRETISLLRKTTKKSTVFAQNPSAMLSFISVVYGQLFNRTVVIDAHNIGIIFEHPIRAIRRLGQTINNVIMKLSSITIVTNEELSSLVRQSGGRPFILPDPLPELHPKEKIILSGQFNVIAICTFANDEPYNAMFEAARQLPSTTYIYFTGNHKKIAPPPELSNNIIFTGYLDEQDYIDHLNSSDIVLDLTKREACLVCGAYEGMALGKPLILSDTKTLREYFGEGATYTKNSPEAIAEAIQTVTGNLEKVTELVLKRRAEIIRDYPEKIQTLQNMLSQNQGASSRVQDH